MNPIFKENIRNLQSSLREGLLGYTMLLRLGLKALSLKYQELRVELQLTILGGSEWKITWN